MLKQMFEPATLRVPVGNERSDTRRVLFLLVLLWHLGVGWGYKTRLEAQEAPSLFCPARTARVLQIKDPNWISNLLATSLSGGRIQTGNCKTSLDYVTIAPGGAAAVDDFPSLFCGTLSQVSIVELEVEDGVCVSYETEAIYQGLYTVAIPEVGAALEVDGPPKRFSPIRSDGLATFVALIADGPTTALVAVFDGGAQLVEQHLVEVNGFTWFRVPDAVRVGSLTVTNLGTGVAPDPKTPLDVLVFVGNPDGGSPRLVPEVTP